MRVSDTGPGIAVDIREQVFDLYFTTKEVGKGSGMGLAVVHGIVNKQRGAIKVDSTPGAGTTFTIFLPLSGGAPQAERDIEIAIPKGTETILLIFSDERLEDKAGPAIVRRSGFVIY